jgi:hypothetical protein
MPSLLFSFEFDGDLYTNKVATVVAEIKTKQTYKVEGIVKKTFFLCGKTFLGMKQ